MRNKIKIGIIIFSIILFGYCIKSNASISTQSKEVNSGKQFSVSITSNIFLASYSVKAESYSGLTFVTSSGGIGEGTTMISSASALGGTTNLATFTFKAPEVTTDTKYTIKFVATGMGDENLSSVPDSDATATITVKAANNASSGSDNTGSNGGNTNTPAAKSTVAKLSNFGINPKEYDFKGFKKDTYTYTHEVPNNVSEVTVYATPVEGATVTSGTGKFSLKEGENKIEVVVKAEAGNTQTYTLTIKRRTAAEEAALSGDVSDATLKSLGIKPEEYDFSGFQKDKTEYSVEVPEDVEEIEVYAEATNSKAQVSGTGKVQLKKGENKLIVQVTAEDGTTRTYTIEVTRGGTEATATNNEDDGFGLSSLEVNGLTLTPSFKTGTYEYTIELSEDLSSLDIEAIATDEDATIEIIGNENLQQGENTITILVRNEETDETATYQIIVNKNITAEEKMSWLKPSTWGREEIIKVAIIAVLVILIIIAIILKIKLAKEKNNDKDIDLPGGDELDKALAEHQELAEADELEEVERTEGVSEFEEAERQEGVSKLEENKIQEESNFDENEISKEVADSDGTNYIEDIARRRNYKIDYQDNDFSNNSSKRKGKHF